MYKYWMDRSTARVVRAPFFYQIQDDLFAIRISQKEEEQELKSNDHDWYKAIRTRIMLTSLRLISLLMLPFSIIIHERTGLTNNPFPPPRRRFSFSVQKTPRTRYYSQASLVCYCHTAARSQDLYRRHGGVAESHNGHQVSPQYHRR